MATETIQVSKGRARWRNFFQPQDFAWMLFVAVLLITAPETNYDLYILVPLIGALQVIERRVQFFSSKDGQIASVGLKLVLSYLIIGWTYGVLSYYYPIFLIPVVSAATIFELRGVFIVTALAAAGYLCFLLPIFIDYRKTKLPEGYVSLMSMRVGFFAIVAFLVYQQAKAKREEMARTQEAVERLSESNTSLMRAEASLRRSERLAALGQLTAGLAHELRNPLGTIKGSAEILMKEIARQRPEVMSEMAGYIVAEVDRINGLVSSFLDFARPLQVRPVIAELRPALHEVARHLKELAAARDVQVSIRMQDPQLAFAFDPELLKIAISNLLQNAIQGSAPGKEVEIRANASDELVRIFVIDQGEGIPRQHLENIFNPFFTTKPNGVGLGLAIVSKIVDEHHGRINVFSEPGVGTTVEVTLPKTQPA
ncbi:MAG: hypothetical protein JOZ62_09990 [Acidobacteriaceae bacterium]|nr:hypothetical protein [Acidobacteriaceae bacterium]